MVVIASKESQLLQFYYACLLSSLIQLSRIRSRFRYSLEAGRELCRLPIFQNLSLLILHLNLVFTVRAHMTSGL